MPMPEPHQRLSHWYREMLDSTDYLPMPVLLDRHAYTIFARNAYVGIWIAEVRGFLISRYKLSPDPYLFIEYHWDTGEPFGTAKPLSLIERCPLPLRQAKPPSSIPPDEAKALCAWLDRLEEAHPILPGVNTLLERRESALGRIQRRE